MKSFKLEQFFFLHFWIFYSSLLFLFSLRVGIEQKTIMCWLSDVDASTKNPLSFSCSPVCLFCSSVDRRQWNLSPSLRWQLFDSRLYTTSGSLVVWLTGKGRDLTGLPHQPDYCRSDYNKLLHSLQHRYSVLQYLWPSLHFNVYYLMNTVLISTCGSLAVKFCNWSMWWGLMSFWKSSLSASFTQIVV